MKADDSAVSQQRPLVDGGFPWNDAQVDRALRIAGVTMIVAVGLIELARWDLTDKGRFSGDNAYGGKALLFQLNQCDNDPSLLRGAEFGIPGRPLRLFDRELLFSLRKFRCRFVSLPVKSHRAVVPLN